MGKSTSLQSSQRVLEMQIWFNIIITDPAFIFIPYRLNVELVMELLFLFKVMALGFILYFTAENERDSSPRVTA